MNYEIKAVPTEYNGTMFRSRLEATWAAMFDSLGWRWEYEGDPVGDWLPDFTLQTKSPAAHMLVEIKPIFSLQEISVDLEKKITAANEGPCGPEILLLGRNPFPSKTIEGAMALGWIYQWSEGDSNGGSSWEEATVNCDLGEYGLITDLDDFYPRGYGFNRMTGKRYEVPFSVEGARWISMKWGLAKEKTQYRRR